MATTTTSPIRVKQIDHVTVVVKDLDASRKFYAGVLGMEEVPRPGFRFAGLWFQAGSTQVHLILEHPESGPAGNVIADGSSISRTRHMAFEVDDAMEAKARLDDLGVEVVAGPK
ncbi:MAG: VOC family protein, partial [Maioricimonas sp. JB045]